MLKIRSEISQKPPKNRHSACCIDPMRNRRLLTFIAGLALLVLSAGKSLGELATADGKIVTYSFIDDSRGMHQYTIRLTGYKATFQIPPDCVQYFAKDRFQANLKKGD